jgi:hypothetical protein
MAGTGAVTAGTAVADTGTAGTAVARVFMRFTPDLHLIRGNQVGRFGHGRIRDRHAGDDLLTAVLVMAVSIGDDHVSDDQ